MRFRAVLFDLDGTLLDTAPDIMAACNYTLRSFGYAELSEETLRPEVGSGMRAMMRLGVPQIKWNELEPGTPMYETFARRYTEHTFDRTQPFAGIPELIAELDERGIVTGVISNKYEAMIAPLFAHFDFSRSFGAVLGGDSTVHSKPHPEPLLKALEILRVSPGDALYCGDFLTDVQAAHNAGCAACAVKWGYGEDKCGKIETWNADFIAQVPHDILKALSA